jgi:hypothetical protein
VRKWLKELEARVGFEPTNGGFADLSLRPLGYRAFGSSIAEAKETGEAAEAKEKQVPRPAPCPTAPGCLEVAPLREQGGGLGMRGGLVYRLIG